MLKPGSVTAFLRNSAHWLLGVAVVINSPTVVAAACNFVSAASQLSPDDPRVRSTTALELTFNNRTSGCSGSLVAATDGSKRGRIITAAHCLGVIGAAQKGVTLDLTIYWEAIGTSAQKTSAANAAKAKTQATATVGYVGASVGGSNEFYDPDIALLELPTTVSVPNGVHFTAFDASVDNSDISVTTLGFPADANRVAMQMQIARGNTMFENENDVNDSFIQGGFFWRLRIPAVPR